MAEAGWLCERSSCRAGLKEIGVALHDLCQPLTTLQCRLEMAGLLDTAEAYREGVETALVDCERLVEAVSAMRAIVRAGTQEAAETELRLRR